jgi:hypothetical protein
VPIFLLYQQLVKFSVSLELNEALPHVSVADPSRRAGPVSILGSPERLSSVNKCSMESK